MSDDGLSAATAALRARFPGSSARAAATESAVLQRKSLRPRPRRPKLSFLLPAAALITASGAWAAARGWPTLLQLVGSWREDATAPAPPPAPSSSSSPGREVAKPRAALVQTPSLRAVASADPAPQPVAPSAVAPGRLRARATAEPDAEALYREAHRLHFSERDPSRALPAWERYLSRAPHGAFALEARYNRALALYRLGRGAAATTALAPFARGDYGPYRRAEAIELIAKIERADVSR